MGSDHMRLGVAANSEFVDEPRPLAGVRVLTVEQMAALPFATQLLARLGAQVVKIEHPTRGESSRASTPGITDPQGRHVGATFLRNNLNKSSVGIDLKSPEGIDLFLSLAPSFDIVAENFKAGTADRIGIGYAAVREVHPEVIYVSVSGFGQDPTSPYIHRAAYAAIVEGMSGIYEYKRRGGHPPSANPVGALGDISSALFAVVGILAALRHRDRTGYGQRIDVAMLDATLAMTDIVTNFYSMGIPDEASSAVGIIETFETGQGHFVLQVVREHYFEKLAEIVDHPEWLTDDRLASRSGWQKYFDTTIRPGVETWAASMTSCEAVAALAAEGLAAGESQTSEQIVNDRHVAARHMLVELPRPNGDGPPVLVPGNPIKMSRMADGPDAMVPWLGQHTHEILTGDIGLDADRLADLRARGIIS